jgi:hypothetical protein
MELSHRGITAADMIIQAVVAFQAQLAPLDRACDAMIESMTHIKDAATLTEDMVERLVDAAKAIAGLDVAANELKLIAPACDIIARELQP